MIDEKVLARNAVKLDTIKEFLEKLSFETMLVEKSAGVPYDTLFTTIDRTKDQKDIVSIGFSFIPLPSEYIDSLDLLQQIVFLDCDITNDNKSSVLKLINVINLKMTIGSYIIIDNRKVALKYVYLLPSLKSVDEENFKEAIMLYVYMYDLFQSSIIQVANGEKSLSSALKE